MKQMKYSFLLVVTLCIGLLTRAQEFKVAVGDMKDAKLVLDDFSGDLQVEGYAGNEIIVTTNRHFETDDRAKGLKPIYAGGTDNTGIALNMEKSGGRVTLRCLLSITQSGADYKVKVPESMALEITRECGKDRSTTISNIKNEVDFKGCQGVTLSKVTGPLVVSTISGGVNVVFTDVAKDKPISISAISGEVDVTMPAKTAFSLEMSTVSGNMYSDFEFPAPANGMNRVGGGKIRADLNGGGTAIRLHNVSGNIYLRKS